MSHFRWSADKQDFVSYDPHAERAARCSQPWGPMIVGDIKAYKSPLGDGVIDGRSARREHLKKHNCREVDPSEHKVQYRNPKFAAKYGKPLTEGGPVMRKKIEFDI